MLAIVLATIAAVPRPDVARAQRLYLRAHYAEALTALGPDCLETSSPRECERIRGSAHLALGQGPAARAAFARLVVLDPRAELAGASPKLRGLLREVRQACEGLAQLKLAPVHPAGSGATWRLEVVPPGGVPVEGVVVHLDAARLGSERVTLAAQGNAWRADFRPPPGAPRRPVYFVETTLVGGAKVASGSTTAPRELVVDAAPADGDARPGPATEGRGDARARDASPASPAAVPPPSAAAPTRATTPISPVLAPGAASVVAPAAGAAPSPPVLPRWAIWSVAGGAALLVAGGVTWAVLSRRRDDPGRVVVGLRIEEH